VEATIPYVYMASTMRKTTVYLTADLVERLHEVAVERGTSEAELIRIALRNELINRPAAERSWSERRAQLMAAVGTLDAETYAPGYLDDVRAGWRG
jgi:metal-responsive CopG/Arc/MetJ family transcriptional regulator